MVFLYTRCIPVFGVKEFWRVLLDLYCLVKCSYNHSPLWATLSLPPPSLFFVLLKARFFGHPVLCKSNSRNSFSVPTIAEEAASSMFLFLVWVFVFVSCTRWTFSIQCSSNKRYDSTNQLSLLKRFCSKCKIHDNAGCDAIVSKTGVTVLLLQSLLNLGWMQIFLHVFIKIYIFAHQIWFNFLNLTSSRNITDETIIWMKAGLIYFLNLFINFTFFKSLFWSNFSC